MEEIQTPEETPPVHVLLRLSRSANSENGLCASGIFSGNKSFCENGELRSDRWQGDKFVELPGSSFVDLDRMGFIGSNAICLPQPSLDFETSLLSNSFKHFIQKTIIRTEKPCTRIGKCF